MMMITSKKLLLHGPTDEDEYEVKGRVLSLIPLRNRRNTPEGESLVTRITEGMTDIPTKGLWGMECQNI